jgi:very-short-patch-repair endonuclease
MRRDRRQARALRQAGWTVIRLWEAAIRRNPEKCAEQIRSFAAAAPIASRR